MARTCTICRGHVWLCEKHPDKVWGAVAPTHLHDGHACEPGCAGPGVLCACQVQAIDDMVSAGDVENLAYYLRMVGGRFEIVAPPPDHVEWRLPDGLPWSVKVDDVEYAGHTLAEALGNALGSITGA